MRIAVTGASGVLGRGLAARLLSKGHDVVGIARHRPDSWSSAADFIEADIRDAAAVNRAVTGADVVAHFAWAHDTREGTGSQVNIAGTANVLAAMAETSARRIVFPSSPHVYGGGDTPRSEADGRRRGAASPRRGDARRLRTRIRHHPLRARRRPQRRQLGAPGSGAASLPRRDRRSPHPVGAPRRRAATTGVGGAEPRNTQRHSQSRCAGDDDVSPDRGHPAPPGAAAGRRRPSWSRCSARR